MECPKCGKPRKVGDQECDFCGVHFSIFDQKEDGGDDGSDKTIASFGETPKSDAKVQTACPKCGQEYTIREDQIGLNTRCKKCKSPFKTEVLS